MSDPKNIDWNEVVEDAQRLDMLRLQREQTDLLRGMSSGGNNTKTPGLIKLESKLGVVQSQDPIEFQKRYKAWQKKEMKKFLKFFLIFQGSILLIVLIAQFL